MYNRKKPSYPTFLDEVLKVSISSNLDFIFLAWAVRGNTDMEQGPGESGVAENSRS